VLASGGLSVIADDRPTRRSQDRPWPIRACCPRSGPVGDAYDTVLAESFADSVKAELVADRIRPSLAQLSLQTGNQQTPSPWNRSGSHDAECLQRTSSTRPTYRRRRSAHPFQLAEA
jgi:hypothetical protein